MCILCIKLGVNQPHTIIYEDFMKYPKNISYARKWQNFLSAPLGEKTLSRMHRDVSESEEEGVFDDQEDPNDDYEKLFKRE